MTTTGELGQTRSYRGRGFSWLPSDTRAGEGALTVCCLAGKKSVTTTYGVTELATPLGRGFRLERLTADPAAEPYDVLIAGPGGHDSCDCRGFQRHGHCKHRDSVAALVEAGAV
jgi:hypothetical protein